MRMPVLVLALLLPWSAVAEEDRDTQEINRYVLTEATLSKYASAVEKLRRETGAARITLVCHSMGGLAARTYLRRHGHHAVQRLIVLP